MNNKDILKIKKDNYAKNLNTLHSNTKSKGLEDNVKSYNKNLNLSKNNNYQNISNQQNSTIQRINSARLKNAYGNSLATNKAASAGLSAVGVPKPLADKVVNSEIGQKALDKVKKQVPALNMLNKLTGGNDSQELPSGSGGVNFQLSMKFIKIATISFIPTLVIIVFCCLFISASQVYSKAIGLGNADNVSLPDAESKIKDVKDDKLNEETTDDKVAFVGNVSKFMNSKLIQTNLVLDDSSKTVAKKRNFNEAEISKLEDYYSQAIDYSKQYDMDMVYTFYFKLYYINQYYQNKYHVNLDMPLIMATLNMQSTEMGDIFASNIKDYDFNSKSDNPYFAYDYDWTSYITTKTNSTHDIEVLAQNMVSETTDDKCTNPITKKDENGNDIKVCYVLDEDKYREFLKEFLEKKYQKEKFKHFKQVNELKIDDDEAYIELKVNDLESITNKFSISGNISLTQEFYDAIEKKNAFIPLDFPLVLEIHSSNFNAEEKILVRKLIKNHFTLVCIEKEMELKSIKRKSRFFLACGIIGFILLFFLKYISISFSIQREA